MWPCRTLSSEIFICHSKKAEDAAASCFSEYTKSMLKTENMNKTAGHFFFSLCLCPPRPHLELVNFLLTCGDKVRSWVSRRLRGQCEHHWGALCSSFTRTCGLSRSDAMQHATTPPHTVPWSVSAQEPSQQPTSTSEPDHRNGRNQTDNATELSLHMFEKANVTAS